jgi:hypothetical protein
MKDFKPPFPYLRQSSKGTRANKLSMAAPMAARWTYRHSLSYIENLNSLVIWMDVENSRRWKPERNLSTGKNMTYCDEAAEDFLDQLFGPYKVPFAASVWWTDKSLESIEAGSIPAISWPTTVKSNGAKGLNDWLHDWSETYGWQVFENEEDFYNWLNSPGNHIGVISTDGHVTIALPDKVNPLVKTSGTIPLQTQAGAQNRQFFRSNSWYKKNSSVIFVGRDFPA